VARPARRKASIAAALALAGAAVAIGALAVADVRAVRRVRADLEGLAQEVRTRTVRDTVAPERLRDALAELRELQQGPAWRHPWARTVGAADVADAAAVAADVVAQAERIVAARAQNREWLQRAEDRLARARTIPELETLRAEADAGGPGRESVLEPAVLADLGARIGQRMEAFLADDRRNEAAVTDAARALADAGGDVAVLLRVVDRVLPMPDRRAPRREGELAEVRGDARRRRAELLRAQLAGILREADAARTAASVAVAEQAIARDPDLRRPEDEALAREITDARARLAARSAGLRAWEAARTAVEHAYRTGNPAAAAAELAAMQPPDAAHASELDAMRAGFPARASLALANGVLERAQAGDWRGARRVAESMNSAGAAWAMLDDEARNVAQRTLRELSAVEDRALYEEFRRAPSAGAAARYLEGWPVRRRAMAPVVLSWAREASRRDVTLVLESAAWDRMGGPAAPEAVRDLPDAAVVVRLDGARAMEASLEDVVEGTRRTFDPAPRATLPADADVVRVSVEVRIDLRDTLIADPIATDTADATPAELRAARGITLAATDPSWSGRPHLLRLRCVQRGLPALPPWIEPR
jgi:hypothetical protein